MTTPFFGYEEPSGFAYTKKFFLHSLTADPHDLFMKIEDLDAQVEVDILDDKGDSIGKELRTRIICAGDWRVYSTYIPPKENTEAETNGDSNIKHTSPAERFPFLKTAQEQSDAVALMDDFMARRLRACTEPHVLCFILFTDPEYQYKGAGRMMMQWGNNVADAMMLPCWIEASPNGEHLYELMGYEGKERVAFKSKSFTSDYNHMRRPAKVNKMVGKALSREL